MYTLYRDVGWKKAVWSESPSLGISLVIAELFYKFHSFSLECVAFLATWFAVSYLFSLAAGMTSALNTG